MFKNFITLLRLSLNLEKDMKYSAPNGLMRQKTSKTMTSISNTMTWFTYFSVHQNALSQYITLPSRAKGYRKK